jgi:hypothetical protein
LRAWEAGGDIRGYIAEAKKLLDKINKEVNGRSAAAPRGRRMRGKKNVTWAKEEDLNQTFEIESSAKYIRISGSAAVNAWNVSEDHPETKTLRGRTNKFYNEKGVWLDPGFLWPWTAAELKELRQEEEASSRRLSQFLRVALSNKDNVKKTPIPLGRWGEFSKVEIGAEL